jgi:hypothetical protein
MARPFVPPQTDNIAAVGQVANLPGQISDLPHNHNMARLRRCERGRQVQRARFRAHPHSFHRTNGADTAASKKPLFVRLYATGGPNR